MTRKRKNRNDNKFSVLNNQYNSKNNNINNHFDKPEEIIVGFKNRLKPRSINQKEYIRTVAENTITFCQGVPGSGKALTLNAKLFTRTGPITMGQVKIGDEIANPDGSFSKVLAIYPQGKKRVFRVYFSNETYVDCCEEHLWEIKHHGKKNKIVVNTKYLMDNCKGYENKRVLSIECTKPVNFDRKTYVIDPYLLGIIISEGNCTNGNVVFTTCESEILSKVESSLDSNYTIKTKEKIDHRIVKKQRSSKNNIYKEELKMLDLWGKYSYEKHIPEIYKYGSIDQRIALLQGLMDGDGTVSKEGSASYSTTSYRLAKDFCELVYSLGGTTKTRTKKGCLKTDGGRHRTSYRCHISLPNDISMFFLDRKKRKQIPRTKYFPKLYIDRVEKLGYQEMQCITVDHKNSLYLTDNYIPTHNTHIAIGMSLEYLLDLKVKKIVITRPIVEAGERMGFLPGTAEEKLHPYLLPLFDEIDYFLKTQHFLKLKHTRQIEVVPLGLMRGRSFHDAFIVADECQNASYEQIKMLLTRIGNNSKMVLTGDVNQSDLQKNCQGGFYRLSHVLEKVDGVGVTSLEASDIIRNPIIGQIIDKINQDENPA